MTRTDRGAHTKRVSHIPPMSMRVPTNGSARIADLTRSPRDENRKMSPSSPAIKVWPNRCVWLVWIRSGVLTQTLATLLMSPMLISLSADWCWPWPLGPREVMGIAREARLHVGRSEAHRRRRLTHRRDGAAADTQQIQRAENLRADRKP